MPAPTRSEQLARLEALVGRMEDTMRLRFLSAVRLIEDRLTLREIIEMVERGDMSRAVDAVTSAATVLADQWTQAFALAAIGTAQDMTQALSTFVSYDPTHTSAIRAVQENRARLVTEMTREAQENIAGIVARSFDTPKGAINPIETAREIRQGIGLTSRQNQMVANYRRALESGSSGALSRKLRDRRFDRTVQRAIDGEITLRTEQIDRMVERYRQRMLRFRAETIARTEALGATNAGQGAMFQQAIDAGELEADELVRRWSTSRDSRVRDSHRSMEGQLRRHDEPFTTGAGRSIRYPHDPAVPAEERIQCRCLVTFRLRPADVARELLEQGVMVTT